MTTGKWEIFCVPFISRILQPVQIHKNNGLQIFNVQ